MLLSGGANPSEDPSKRKVGTPFYLAPELWEDKPCSKKSDIWSLGVILYELCTYKYPYMANNVEEL
jgi:NIMA (never in mitosis gene a)-related kinase